MAAADPHFRLRIPEDLKARIERSAEENARSINAEIVYRLKGTFGVETSEADMLDRRIRDIANALHAAEAVRAQATAEVEARSRALDEARRMREELRTVEERRHDLNAAVRKAERA